MEIVSFLKKISSPDFFQTHKTVCFRGQKDRCPVLFFSLFLQFLKKTISDSLQTIDCAQEELSVISAQLATSFLGNKTVFWFTNIAAAKPKKKKQLLSILKSYKGPNAVLFFLDETVACTKRDFDCVLQLPPKIDQKQCAEFAAVLSKPIAPKTVRALFAKSSAIDLDKACLLVQYVALLGKNTEDFTAQWLHQLVEPEHSLQSLSGSLFAKNSKKFFSLWQQLGPDYPPQFWISFWSEQFWRAFYFMQYSHNKQFIEAKRISFRLPYSFINGDWRRLKADQLRDAHKLLYAVDCSLKNGGNERSLELVYTNFFSN